MFTGPVPQKPAEVGEGRFEDLGLGDPILGSLRRIGFERPTPIQWHVIPRALEGRDIIGLAQTGSGKTGAFALPMAERLLHGRGLRGLIVCPTREIALQTRSFLEAVGEDHELRTVCLIGGVRMGPQISGLRQKPDIVVATPGRLLDHLRRRNLTLDRVEQVVLDEGDHMLDLGFLPQILQVLERLPARRQTMLFSATMPREVERLAERFLQDPVRIDLRPEGRAAEGIEHRLYLVDPESVRPALMAVVDQEPGSMLVFLRRRVDAEWACRQLELAGHPVERIHSDRSQRQRVEALQGLRDGEHRVLVATDIAARGLDLPIVAHVVNVGMPGHVEDYIHRSGRTARGSMEGIASTIATWQDKQTIREVESALGRSLPRLELPGIPPWVEARTTIRGRRKLRRRLL